MEKTTTSRRRGNKGRAVRNGLLYLVGAVALFFGAHAVSEWLELPYAFASTVFNVAVIGIPAALFLAWLFAPSNKAGEADETRDKPPSMLLLVFAAIVLAVVIAGAIAWVADNDEELYPSAVPGALESAVVFVESVATGRPAG
ncbi:MAG: hypothetical protein AAF660_15280 [Pseudomonadota bacterium]